MSDPAFGAAYATASPDDNEDLQGHGGDSNAAIDNHTADAFQDDKGLPACGVAGAMTAQMTNKVFRQEMEASLDVVTRANADEAASADDVDVPEPPFDPVANPNFLQDLGEQVNAEVQNGEDDEDSDDEEDGIALRIYPLLYYICLLLGTLVIAVSSAVAMYRVETSPSWSYEQTVRECILVPVGVFSCLKWRVHGFLAANLITAIVGFLGAIRLNLRLLLLYIFVEGALIPIPFIIALCCFVPHSMSCYVLPSTFQYIMFVVWEGNTRSLWIPMLFAGPVIAACFTCAAKLYDAIELAMRVQAHIAAMQERRRRRRIQRRRG